MSNDDVELGTNEQFAGPLPMACPAIKPGQTRTLTGGANKGFSYHTPIFHPGFESPAAASSHRASCGER
eukprot:2417999-Rhodomonas_salina.1